RRLQNLALRARRSRARRLRIAQAGLAFLFLLFLARLAGRLSVPGPRGRRRRRRRLRRSRRLTARRRRVGAVGLVARVEHLLQLRERQLRFVAPFVLDTQAFEHQQVLFVRAQRLLEQDADLLAQLFVVDLALLLVRVAQQLRRDRRVDERIVELFIERSD